MVSRVTPVRVYLTVFAALLVLTALTVAASWLQIGIWHTPLALAIAACKAVLVGLFFMHLLHSDRLTWLIVGGSFLWLAILFALTLSDYLARPAISLSGG
jgi:cytochrome c oxidase subunit IV